MYLSPIEDNKLLHPMKIKDSIIQVLLKEISKNLLSISKTLEIQEILQSQKAGLVPENHFPDSEANGIKPVNSNSKELELQSEKLIRAKPHCLNELRELAFHLDLEMGGDSAQQTQRESTRDLKTDSPHKFPYPIRLPYAMPHSLYFLKLLGPKEQGTSYESLKKLLHNLYHLERPCTSNLEAFGVLEHLLKSLLKTQERLEATSSYQIHQIQGLSQEMEAIAGGLVSGSVTLPINPANYPHYQLTLIHHRENLLNGGYHPDIKENYERLQALLNRNNLPLMPWDICNDSQKRTPKENPDYDGFCLYLENFN